jgi:hypothetical protein
MELDITLDTKKIQVVVARATTAMGKVYAEVNRHYGWTDTMAQVGAGA